MSTKTRPSVKRTTQPAVGVNSPPLQPPRMTFAPPLKRPLPAKSVAKAGSAFKNFSLSKFAGQSTPPHYVPAGETPTTVHRKIIMQHLQKLSETDTSNGAMTFALPQATIKKLLPSYNPDAATIETREQFFDGCLRKRKGHCPVGGVRFTELLQVLHNDLSVNGCRSFPRRDIVGRRRLSRKLAQAKVLEGRPSLGNGFGRKWTFQRR